MLNICALNLLLIDAGTLRTCTRPFTCIIAETRGMNHGSLFDALASFASPCTKKLWLKVCSLEDHDFGYCIGWPSYCKPCSCALLDVTNFDFSFFKKCEHPTECKQEKMWHCSGSVLATYWNFNLYAVKCGPSQTVLWNWVLCTRLKTALALFILLCKAQKGHRGGKKLKVIR